MSPREIACLAALTFALSSAPAAGAAPAAVAAPPGLPPGITAADGAYVSQKDGMPMVLVPGGEFVMGSAAGSYDERPPHRVVLGPFLIDRHEVTNAQFARFVSDSGYRPSGPWRRGFALGAEQHPVRFVTWYDAQAYARWAGRALPTEAQWELAARGSQGLTYPWGPDWRDGAARIGVDVDAGPLPVGSLPGGKSPAGCLDMAGNVWEWVQDWYDRYYYQSLPPGARAPAGPPDGAPPEERFSASGAAAGNERSTRKVVRGGGFASRPDDARGARRQWGNPRYWLNDTGFRCAVTLGGAS